MDQANDQEAQQAARDAVLAMRLFPDLERSLILSLGPGAAAIMLHQICYWFSKPKMRDRWWMYKTFDEWECERGLRRRRVETGRRDLVKKGLVEEAYGPYKKVHLRPDWPVVAATLNLNPIVQREPDVNRIDKPQTPENERTVGDCTAENGHAPHRNAGKPSEQGERSRLYATNRGNHPFSSGKKAISGVQTNTGDYAEDYEQEISLSESANPADAESAPPEEKEGSRNGTAKTIGEIARLIVEELDSPIYKYVTKCLERCPNPGAYEKDRLQIIRSVVNEHLPSHMRGNIENASKEVGRCLDIRHRQSSRRAG